MLKFTAEELRRIMDFKHNIRNMSVIAHVDHDSMFFTRCFARVYPLLTRKFRFFSNASRKIIDLENEVFSYSVSHINSSTTLKPSPIFSDDRLHIGGYNIQLVDHDTWCVSSTLAQVWGKSEQDRAESNSKTRILSEEDIHDPFNYGSATNIDDGPDFDDIDSMRIRGNLFYKLDRNSKEYEEYSFDFHRKKKSSKKKEDDNTKQKEDNRMMNSTLASEKVPQISKEKFIIIEKDTISSACLDNKRQERVPTFNQLTAPYHEPFCLDIFISKGSVRACVIHRLTSKVVAVAHSISKDMKFDLNSRRDSTACAAVGEVLAQRALADDIHDVVYTPRKGDRMEGKLQIVLDSIINHGINVKVKLKQRRPMKARSICVRDMFYK